MMDAKDVIEGLAIAHAQGFAAGQRDMRERAAERMNGFGKDIFARLIRAMPIKDQP